MRILTRKTDLNVDSIMNFKFSRGYFNRNTYYLIELHVIRVENY